MAKKYNIKDRYVGGYVFFKRGDLTTKQYREKWISENIDSLRSAYNRLYEKATVTNKYVKGALDRFKQVYPDVNTWAQTIIKGRFRRKTFSIKGLKELVINKIAYKEIRYANHIKTLIEDSPYADEFRLRIGSQIDTDRMSYEGNATYVYYCEDGTYLRFMFSDYSPTILIFLDNEE